MSPGLRAALGRGITRLTARPLFASLFGAFLIAAAWFGVAYPLGPGQDAHYHFFNAVVVSKLWTGDPFYPALYETVNPLDSNSLLYTFLFPFELVLAPMTAWRVGFTLAYLVGYPVACLVALRLLRRPLWGALLAFPLAYAVKTFSQGGYLPFVSAAPLMVVSVALLHRINEGTASRRMQVACVATTSLCFVAHAHVYAWLMVLLGTATLVALVLALIPGLVQRPKAALWTAFVTGLRALAIVTPSLVLFGAWWQRTHHGAHADAGWSLRPTEATLLTKVQSIWALLVHVQGDRELAFLLGLGIVLFACLALGRRRRETGVPTAELAVVLTFVSWWLLPADVSGQMVADRHMDLLVWLLPLAVYAGEPAGGLLRHGLAVSILVVYAWLRLAFYGDSMRVLQKEYAGMVALGTKSCPTPRGELAYVTSTAHNAQWYGKGLHQAHETFAAMCRLDTPVYDRVYPHNLLPLRYRGDLPAPITIVVGSTTGWWSQPAMAKFDYVLVQGWQPGPSEVASVPKPWELAARSGVWSLWRKTR